MLLSVIVPVYNAECCLPRCIDSILAQSYRNFELLLIDDGSKDRSSAICDEYSERDDRIKVFHKDNGGVSSARNLGLDKAQGEWITFVDSDDSVSVSYLENLVSHSKGVDLVISYAEIIYSDGQHKREVYGSNLVTNNYDALFVDNDLNWHTSPWAKLYNRSLCEDKRFVEGMHIGEDLCFLYDYMLGCSKVYVSSDTDYFYYVDNLSSLTKRINKLSEEQLAYEKVSEAVERLVSIKEISDPIAIKKMGWIIAYYVRRVLNAIYYDGQKRNFRERIRRVRSLNVEQYIKNIEISSYKERVYVLLLKYRLYTVYDSVRMLIKWIKR